MGKEVGETNMERTREASGRWQALEAGTRVADGQAVMERGRSREMENSVHLGTPRVSPNDRWMLPTAKGSFSPKLNNVQNILHQRPEIDRLLTKLLKFYKRCVKGTMFLISQKNHTTQKDSYSMTVIKLRSCHLYLVYI